MTSLTRQMMIAALVFSLLTAGSASAQSFNVDFGEPTDGPRPTYAAAGLAGEWNSIRAEHTTPFTIGPHPDDYMLVDINGNQTNVGFHNFGGLALAETGDPSVTGDSAKLLTDYLVTFDPILETCLYLNGLQNGMYEMLNYAWMPQQPDNQARVRFDDLPGQDVLVGGAWTGAHAEGTTFSRTVLIVTNGHIGWHVGIPPGGNGADGAAANGFQLRLLPPYTPGDLDCDGTVTGGDIGAFVQAFLDPEAYALAHPSCNIANADIDGDMVIDEEDVGGFVQLLLNG